MSSLRKKIFATAGYTTVFMGAGRKEFNPQQPMRQFEDYITETAQGTCAQIPLPTFDEGIIGSFMAARFIQQGNLPGFLPFMLPALTDKPCTAVEGACGTGGRAIAMGIRSILSELSQSIFVAGFEIQNTVKSVYGADILAGAAYYNGERKNGHAHFFPGIFSDRAGRYYEKYGYALTREAMATWYKNAIENARKNPKAQEYQNTNPSLFETGMLPPDPKKFVPHLNHTDCSKISDGAASLLITSEEGLQRSGIPLSQAIEIIGIGEAVADITKKPIDPTFLSTTSAAVKKALAMAKISLNDIAILEIHDCFTITALLALEAIGLAPTGQAPAFILEGNTHLKGKLPTNLSGGLGGFGHPTGATGVRQLVDLHQQLTGTAPNQAKLHSPYGMMISMGGNDRTVTCLIVKKGS